MFLKKNVEGSVHLTDVYFVRLLALNGRESVVGLGFESSVIVESGVGNLIGVGECKNGQDFCCCCCCCHPMAMVIGLFIKREQYESENEFSWMEKDGYQ